MDYNPKFLKNLEPLPEIVVHEDGEQTVAKHPPTRSVEERLVRAGVLGYGVGFILCLVTNLLDGHTGYDLFWSMWTYTGLCLFVAACVIVYRLLKGKQHASENA